MPGGRPTDLTPEVIEQVKQLLPVALHIETVANFLGRTRRTFSNWLKWGSQEYQRLAKNKRAKPIKSEALYLEFFLVYKKALGEGEFRNIEIVNQAATEQWTAAAWILERRFPERWSRERSLLLDLVKQNQENRDELARLRASVNPSNTPGTGQTPGGSEANPAAESSRDHGSD